jgi:hypothetical protein
VTPASERTHWPTVAAAAGLAAVLNVLFHEGMHALVAMSVGAQVRQFSSLFVDAVTTAPWQARIIAGSASVANLWAGTVLWLVLRGARNGSVTGRWFLWLLMLMNWLYGAGYWMFSGAAGVGDWADVIQGWPGADAWRIGMFVAGSVLFMVFVWQALREFGRIAAPAAGPAAVSWITAAAVVAGAGAFCPYGWASTPVTAGLAASLGALSPLLWMMSWMRARMFVKVATEPLVIRRSWPLVGVAAAAVIVFCVVLGRSITF